MSQLGAPSRLRVLSTLLLRFEDDYILNSWTNDGPLVIAFTKSARDQKYHPFKGKAGWMDGWDGMGTSPTGSWNDCLHYKPHRTIPLLQISRREPRHALHSPFHFPHIYYRLFSDHRHFSSIPYHIILHLDFPLLMSFPSCPIVVHNRVSFIKSTSCTDCL